MNMLWLGIILSLRDQGIPGNFWAWAGVRSCIDVEESEYSVHTLDRISRFLFINVGSS